LPHPKKQPFTGKFFRKKGLNIDSVVAFVDEPAIIYGQVAVFGIF
jgi:hypothetical protein